MKVSSQKRSFSVSGFLLSFLSFGLFFYFAYHLMHGDRGYFAWKGLEKKLATAESRYEDKLAERVALENRVRLLRPDSLDLDMLDERARVVLGFVKPNEIVVVSSR